MLSFYLAAIESPEDKELFATLYREYKSFMFNVANRNLNDPHLAENVVHDAFVRMMENLQKFNLHNGHNTKGLIGIIVDGLAKDEYRRRKKLSFFDEVPDESTLTDSILVEEQVIEQDQFDNLKVSINKLDSMYANAVLLRYEHHYSTKEIAEITGVSEDTVRQRLHRAKLKLKELLAREGQTL